MKRYLGPVFVLLIFFTPFCAADEGVDVIAPKVPDRLARVTLSGDELGGEINRRICDLVYKNYMVLDLESNWLDHFRHRTDRGDTQNVYYGVGKVIDAGSLFAQYTGDEAVAQRTQYLLDEIIKTQDSDGYIGFWNREPNDYQDFVNWIVHEQEYFTLASVRHYRTTGSAASLETARLTADHLMRTFAKNEQGVYYIPSPISIAGVAEAAIELYRVTGEPKYLDFAENLQYEPHWFYEPFALWREKIDHRGFHQYVMLSHLYPETELYRLSGDETRLLKSDWMRHALLEKDYGALLVTGSSSNGEQFTRDQQGTGNIEESCVTAYLLRFFDSLERLEGNLRYGDIMERTIYNALFAAQDPTGRKIRYFTPFSGERAYFGRDTFCCPGNFRRAVAELPQKVYYRTNDGGIAVNLYTPSHKAFDINGKQVTLRQETDYPNNGSVKFTIEAKEPVEFSLTFRTPRWCETMTAQINGETPIPITPKEQINGGYTIRRIWKNGDTLALDMPLVWRFVEGRVKQAGHVAVLRGPVVYCLGQAQNAALVDKCPNLRDITLDPASFGEPEKDDATRPDGRKVRVKGKTADGEAVEIVLTEFPDETGREIYFRLPNDSTIPPVADELLDEPSTEPRWEIVSALVGPKSAAPLADFFAPTGSPVADLAADYVRPEGNQTLNAEFASNAGTWSVWLCRGKDLNAAADSDKTLLCASNPVYDTPNAFAYGSGDTDALGFLADWNPTDPAGENWRKNFTQNVFDSVIPAAKRGEFLLTHPVGDSGRFLIIRIKPNEAYANRPTQLAGTILCRAGGDGVTFEMIGTVSGKRQPLSPAQTVAGTSGSAAATVDFFQTVPAASDSIDFVLGNNGSHTCDSVALSLRLYAADTQVDQRDVTADVVSSIHQAPDQTQVEPGAFHSIFGDSASGEQTLKLYLRNKITGEVQYQELTDSDTLEL